VLFSTGRINETIELQAQVMALEPRAIFPSRDQQFNLYAAGRFEEVEAEYQRSRTLDGSHTSPDVLAFTRGLANQDADPQALRELFEDTFVPGLQNWWNDFGSAIPNRQDMLAVLRSAPGTDAEAAAVLADAMGDRDIALSALRTHLKSTRGKFTGAWYAPWLLVHSGARADPRFKEVMREGGLAVFWRQSGQWADFCGPVGEHDFECH
jgi:hypothetical protein